MSVCLSVSLLTCLPVCLFAYLIVLVYVMCVVVIVPFSTHLFASPSFFPFFNPCVLNHSHLIIFLIIFFITFLIYSFNSSFISSFIFFIAVFKVPPQPGVWISRGEGTEELLSVAINDRVLNLDMIFIHSFIYLFFFCIYLIVCLFFNLLTCLSIIIYTSIYLHSSLSLSLIRYEITEVAPDHDMMDAMNKQAAAERGERREFCVVLV